MILQKKYIWYYVIILILIVGSCSSKPKTMTEAEPPMPPTAINLYDSVANNAIVEKLNIKKFQLDTLFLKAFQRNQFNGCVLVMQHGKVIYKRAFGWADPSTGKILESDSKFQLASVSKPLTASAILLLHEAGYFSLDDKFCKFFPTFPYTQVTIRELLSHRSGLPNYLHQDKKWFPVGKNYYSNEDVLNALTNARLPYQFAPNSRFVYNNSNYALLALLVEKISGMSFPNFMKKYIFQPLGMKNSAVVIPDSATAEQNYTKGLYANNRNYGTDAFDGVFGDKGIYSTVEDLAKFHVAMLKGTFLKKKILEEAYTNHVTESNRLKQYGLGWRMRVNPVDSSKIIYHNGWWHGYRTAFHRRLEDNSTVIILSNRLNGTVYRLAKESFFILDQYHPPVMQELSPEEGANE